MIGLSFEFFPPKDQNMNKRLLGCLSELSVFLPKFVSVTYGADGSTRDRTHNIVKKIAEETSLVCAPHLTCVGSNKEKLITIINSYWDQGIRDIVALRGDLPKYDTSMKRGNEFSHAVELVDLISNLNSFNISVAAYPEVHPEAKNAEEDIDYLKKKIDAGASRAITQFFFDVDIYLRFRDRCKNSGIEAEIIPGILPINNFDSMLNFSEKCGVSVPKYLFEKFLNKKIDNETKKNISIDYCKKQIELLSKAGVKNCHFYTLNKSELISKILEE